MQAEEIVRQLDDHLTQMGGVLAAGIIGAVEISPKLEAAAKTNTNVCIVEYALRIEMAHKDESE